MGCSGSMLALCSQWTAVSWTSKAFPSSIRLTGCDWRALARRHTEVAHGGLFGPVRASDEIEVRMAPRLALDCGTRGRGRGPSKGGENEMGM